MLTGGGHEALALPAGVRSLGRVPGRRARARSTAAPPRSCSRAATRASARRCSRRWRAAAPWPRRPASRRSRRSPAGPPCCFEPDVGGGDRRRRSSAALADAPRSGRARPRACRARSRGSEPPGSTTRSTRSSRRTDPSLESLRCRTAVRVCSSSTSTTGPGVEATAHLLTELCEALAVGVRRDRRHRPAARPGAAARRSRCGTASRIVRVRSTAYDRALARPRGRRTTSRYLGARRRPRARRSPRPDVVLCMTDPPMVGDVAPVRRAPLPRAARGRQPGRLPGDRRRAAAAREPGRSSRCSARSTRFYLRRADRVVAIGETMKQRLEREGRRARAHAA